MTIAVSQRRLTQPLKYHGGKHYLAKKLIEMMPPHLHYVEPFFGGGSVLWARDHTRDWLVDDELRLQYGDKIPAHMRGCSEVANDLNGILMNFWRVLRDATAFSGLECRLRLTPVSKSAWDEAVDRCHPQTEMDIEAAAALFILNRQSRQGLMKDFATLSRTRTRRGMNEQASAFLTAIDGLVDVHDRLQRVVILNDDACTVIRQQDGERTLFYCDPPYVHNTRTATSAYALEMTDADHSRLLTTIKQCVGKVMLSGYRNPLYDRELVEWNRRDIAIDNKASSATTKRKMTESVWTNY